MASGVACLNSRSQGPEVLLAMEESARGDLKIGPSQLCNRSPHNGIINGWMDFRVIVVDELGCPFRDLGPSLLILD